MQKTTLALKELFKEVLGINRFDLVEKLGEKSLFHYVVPHLFLLLYERYSNKELFVAEYKKRTCIAFKLDSEKKSSGVEGWFLCFSNHGEPFDFTLVFHEFYDPSNPKSCNVSGFSMEPLLLIKAWYTVKKDSYVWVTKKEHWSESTEPKFWNDGPNFSGNLAMTSDRQENDQRATTYATNIFLFQVIHEIVRPTHSWRTEKVRSFTVALATTS